VNYAARQVMKPRRETLQFRQPLQSAALRAAGPVDQIWEERLEQREQAGYERGRREGEIALAAALERQRDSFRELEQGVLQSLSQVVTQVGRECQGALVSLAMQVARRLVADLPIDRELVERSVREALAEVEAGTDVQVILHPDDLALLQQAGSNLIAPAQSPGRIRFTVSAEVGRGGCLAQTQFGTIDGRRDTKWRRMEQLIRE